MFDIGAFVMRARPFGDQHLYNIKQALECCQYAFVMIGSANEPINFENPFTAEEVAQMVRGSLTPMQNDRVFLFFVENQESDLAWVTEVQRLVKQQADRLSLASPKITLVGYQKDGSGYYQSMFPQWASTATENYGEGMSATQVRNALYNSEDPIYTLGRLEGLPKGTEVFLRQWVHTDEYHRMKSEFLFNWAEGNKFAPHPYNSWTWHETADAACFQSGAVLLVRRGEMPGEGQWALPGGHRQLERFQTTALRELCEETSILALNPDLTMDDLKLAVRGEKLCDNPWRSTRMVTTSVAYGLLLPGTKRLEVKGADDAKEARWWNLDEVTRQMMFEDHYLIIQHFANKFDLR